MSEMTYVGKSVPKIDAMEKVTGQAIYAADVQLPGMLFGKIVRCWEHAHARVTHLDLSEAAKVPGVVKVLGPKDVTQKLYNTGVLDVMVPEDMGKHLLGDIEDQRIFTDHVRHQVVHHLRHQVGHLLLHQGSDPARVGDAGGVLVSVVFEQGQQELDVGRAVIDHQDAGIAVGLGGNRHFPSRRADIFNGACWPRYPAVVGGSG